MISSDSRFCQRVFSPAQVVGPALRPLQQRGLAQPGVLPRGVRAVAQGFDEFRGGGAHAHGGEQRAGLLRRPRGLLGDPRQQLGETRAGVEVGVARLRRGLAHDGGHRQHRRVDPRFGEHRAVAFGDGAPARGGVDLGQRQHDVRAPGAHVPGQRELGGAQRRGRVGDEDHRVRFGEQVERGGGARRARVTDRRGVDQDEPGREEFAGHTDFDAAERACGPGAELTGELFDRDGDAFEGPADQGGGGFVGVPDLGRHGGGGGVADRAHRRVQDGVEQVALALFGKAEDAQPDLLSGGVTASAQELGEIGAAVGAARVEGLVEHFEPSWGGHDEGVSPYE